MYEIGDVFISKERKRVKVAEVIYTQKMDAITVRYRMSGDDRYLSARELRAEFEEVREPQGVGHAQGA